MSKGFLKKITTHIKLYFCRILKNRYPVGTQGLAPLQGGIRLCLKSAKV